MSVQGGCQYLFALNALTGTPRQVNFSVTWNEWSDYGERHQEVSGMSSGI